MTIPAVEQLDQLSREDLLSLVKQLMLIVEKQQAQIAELEAEIAKLRQPPTNSSNSSQPPSRDQKTNSPSNKKGKKHGPPFGHLKYSRPLVENPDRVISAPVNECKHCHAKLKGLKPDDVIRRQITELPAAKPIVIETRATHSSLPTLSEGELRYTGRWSGSRKVFRSESGSDGCLLQTGPTPEY